MVKRNADILKLFVAHLTDSYLELWRFVKVATEAGRLFHWMAVSGKKGVFCNNQCGHRSVSKPVDGWLMKYGSGWKWYCNTGINDL